MNTKPILVMTIAVFGLLESAFADGNRSLWIPGYSYDTHITYQIQVENAELIPGTNKVYKGRYLIPKLIFAPVIEFTTFDIVPKGRNRYAKRIYNMAQQSVSGLSNVVWRSDVSNWAINPKEWYRAYKRYTDDDLGPFKEMISHDIERQKGKAALDSEFDKARAMESEVRKKLDKAKSSHKSEAKISKLEKRLEECKEILHKASEAQKKWLPTEKFRVFYDTENNVVPFDMDNQALFFKWPESAIDAYFRGERGATTLSVMVGDERSKKGLSTEKAIERWSYLSQPNQAIENIVLSEFGVSASSIFDDPTGKARLIDENSVASHKPWRIDASVINGLLATDAIRKLISFQGLITVRAFKLEPSYCISEGFPPFVGHRIMVVESREAKLGYDTGSGSLLFDLQIAPDSKNRIEFWFDANNEVLRYAHVHIEKEDYEGNIPNPDLGTTLSKIKGKVKGRVVFDCEYKMKFGKQPGAEDITEDGK